MTGTTPLWVVQQVRRIGPGYFSWVVDEDRRADLALPVAAVVVERHVEGRFQRLIPAVRLEDVSPGWIAETRDEREEAGELTWSSPRDFAPFVVTRGLRLPSRHECEAAWRHGPVWPARVDHLATPLAARAALQRAQIDEVDEGPRARRGAPGARARRPATRPRRLGPLTPARPTGLGAHRTTT